MYPRYRDAQFALYSCIHGTKGDLKLENVKHAKGVMRSLFRKHTEYWDRLSENTTINGNGDSSTINELKEFEVASKCVTLCELGILQRLNHACGNLDADVSIKLSYACLDRVCHWLLMLNRLMNTGLDKVEVPS